jgi:hypothetical protein
MANAIHVPDIVDENPNGIFAEHPIRATLPVIVAPTTADRKAATNTVRRDFVVLACANFKEYNFAFDSSVVEPRAREGFASLARMIRRHPGDPMSLFGHADPTGEPGYNKWLSERRARSIFAVLMNDASIWEQLYKDPQGAPGDKWGVKSLQLMLTGLGREPGESGKMDDPTKDAIRDLLVLPPLTPVADTAPIRKAIFEKYLEFLRSDPDPKDPQPFPELGPDDFVGKGKQKGTFQGCSEFNPQFLLGKEELDGMEKGGDEGKESRNAANEPNRRVVLFFFSKDSQVNLKKWPCPAAAQGIQGCVDRFWSNGKDRKGRLFTRHRRRFGRSVKPEHRLLEPPNPALAVELGKEETTFACRFYHGVALRSPCERDLQMWVLQVMIDGPTVIKANQSPPAATKVPLAKRRFVAKVGDAADAAVIRGTTTVNGVIGLPLFDRDTAITLKIDAYIALGAASQPEPPETHLDPEAFPDEHRFVTLRLDGGNLKRIRKRGIDSTGFDPDFDLDETDPDQVEQDLGVLQRLYNLGYGSDDAGGRTFGNWTPADRKRFIESYQRDHRPPLDITGTVDDKTLQVLFDDYGS